MSSPTVYHEAYAFVWHSVTEGSVYLDTMTHVPVLGETSACIASSCVLSYRYT